LRATGLRANITTLGLWYVAGIMPNTTVWAPGTGPLPAKKWSGRGRPPKLITTVSTDNVDFAHSLGADVVIDYKIQRFEDHASDLDVVFDLIDGETRARSWKLLKRGGTLVTTLTDPSQDKAKEYGVRALRYTVEADGSELAEIAALVEAGKVKAHISKTFPLEDAPRALASVERGHSVGKVVLVVD
jgi:NADPH:quinone reductase-like Zn-dependent oxidoreductase